MNAIRQSLPFTNAPVVMTTITAADVKKLRDQTGAGMMECKNALSRGEWRLRRGETPFCASAGLASAAKKPDDRPTKG